MGSTVCITACRELIKGDVLVPVTGGDPQIIVQFDGSAHRASQVQEGSGDLQEGHPSVTKEASPSAKHPSKVPFTKA